VEWRPFKNYTIGEIRARRETAEDMAWLALLVLSFPVREGEIDYNQVLANARRVIADANAELKLRQKEEGMD